MKIILHLLSFFFLTFVPLVAICQQTTIKISAPYGTTIDVGLEQFVMENPSGQMTTKLSHDPSYPMTIRAHGPLGGFVDRLIEDSDQLSALIYLPKIIRDKNSRPEVLADLPKICRDVKLLPSGNDQGPQFYAQMDMAKDKLNRQPMMQLLDPDNTKSEKLNRDMQLSFKNFDGKNVLKIESITIRNDYEDSNIVDYVGPHPLTGAMQTVHEGDGGFYANFHYAVVPYNRQILKMDRQTLLHFAQGKLYEIDSKQEPATIKTHGLLPGPFVSREGAYPLCEWGDTSYQAPMQRVDYVNFGIWDWDYAVKNNRHVLIIVWEGDEEDWLINKQLIDPTYLTDDIVGIFEVEKMKTTQPITIKNTNGDFSIRVVTGDIDL